MENYDLIVIGLGAVGSAALCQSALRGARVLGIDRFHPPHEFGSSHGETRITRQAVGEGAEFVPLVLRANVLWRSLEAATGERLLVQNGGLILLDGVEAQGAGAVPVVRSRIQHGIVPEARSGNPTASARRPRVFLRTLGSGELRA